MKTFNKIILIIIGISTVLLIFSLIIGFRPKDVKAFFQESYKYEKIDPYKTNEDINQLKLKLATKNVVIKGHDGEEIIINYYLREKETISIEVNSQIMTIKQTLNQRLFFVNFQIPNETYLTMEILIPQNKQIKLDINGDVSNIKVEDVLLKTSTFKTSTGNISLKNINSDENFNIKTDTGAISLVNIEANDLLVSSETGKILINNFSANDLDLKNSTGLLKVTGGEAKNITVNHSVGSITFKDTLSSKIKINSSTSNVTLNEVDSKNIQIYLETGSVSIKGKYKDYSLNLKTNTGKVFVDGVKKSREFQAEKTDDIIIAETSTGKIVIAYTDW